MIRFEFLFAVACMVITAASAVLGSVLSRSLFCIELLITLSLVYIHGSGGLRASRLFDLPVFMTVRIACSFGLIPIQALLMPERLSPRLQGAEDLIWQALLLVLLGMVAFWTACRMVERRSRSRSFLIPSAPSDRAPTVAVLIYAVGFGCNVYLLQHQMFAYTASLQLYRNNMAGAQIFMFGALFADLGLLLLAIETFSRPSSRMLRVIFWAMLVSQCGWGLISGMKQALLLDILAVAAVVTICRGKIAKSWLLTPVLGLIILYPIFNSYRAVVRGSGANQVSNFGTAFDALGQAIVNFKGSAEYGDWLGTGADLTMVRLDLLQCYALILSLPNRAEEIQGEERLWMIPIFPFVPRLIWPTKPVLDKGARFTKALGGTMDSSSAVPYVADCYMFGGPLGVVIGMFILGIIVQSFGNLIKGHFTKRELFRYSVALLYCFFIEIGVVEWWAGAIKTMLAVIVIEWLAYGAVSKRHVRVPSPAASAAAMQPRFVAVVATGQPPLRADA